MSDLRLLQQFVSVYRNRNFRSAADEMGIAQSSVTKRIQHLEQELGLRLFNRTTRTVEPTDSARQLIDKAENALQAASAFQQEARLIAGGELGGIAAWPDWPSPIPTSRSTSLAAPTSTRISRPASAIWWWVTKPISPSLPLRHHSGWSVCTEST